MVGTLQHCTVFTTRLLSNNKSTFYEPGGLKLLLLPVCSHSKQGKGKQKLQFRTFSATKLTQEWPEDWRLENCSLGHLLHLMNQCVFGRNFSSFCRSKEMQINVRLIKVIITVALYQIIIDLVWSTSLYRP